MPRNENEINVKFIGLRQTPLRFNFRRHFTFNLTICHTVAAYFICELSPYNTKR